MKTSARSCFAARSFGALLLSVLFVVELPAGVPSPLKSLAKSLKEGNYLLYVPFRAEDNPGAIFVFAEDVQGHTNEFVLSSEKNTFEPRGQEAWSAQGGALLIESNSKIESTLTFAVALIKPLVDLSAKFGTVKNVRITLPSGPGQQQIRRLPLENTFAKLSDQARDALKFYKTKDQLENAYIVLETYWVASLNVEVTAETEASAKAAVEAIKLLKKANVEVAYTANNVFTLKVGQGMNIGYKAMRLTETVIPSKVSGPTPVAVATSAAELEALRFGRD